jgi:hypothetical protein
MNSSEGFQTDLNQQEQIKHQVNFEGFGGKEELWKHNPSKERIKYEIGQRTTKMKTTNKKIKQCSNKYKIKIVKLLCL